MTQPSVTETGSPASENVPPTTVEERTEVTAAQPASSEVTPVARKSGGQGEVRSPNDRRLRDNLDPEKRKEIGRKGGEAVSRNREHMAQIGRKGGVAVSKNREHMAQIGREGGRS